ncbi:MAG: helicase-related protein, partial [Candidatus Helarchaeales archaeon]
DLLSRGVAFHHGGLSLRARQLIEDAIKKYPIKIITCTSTLAAGINTPVRSVIIRDISIHVPDSEFISNAFSRVQSRLSPRELEPNLFHQIIGRAGRPQYKLEHGIGVVLVRSNDEKTRVTNQFFYKSNGSYKPKYNRVQSRFNNPSTLAEQVLVYIHDYKELSKEEIEKMFQNTFWWHETSRRHPNARIEEFLELSSLSLAQALRKFTNPALYEKATRIKPEEIVKLHVSRHYLKCIFRDPTLCTTTIRRNHVYCSCGSFNPDTPEDSLCIHLIRLMIEGFKHDPRLTSVIVSQAMQKKFILPTLIARGFLIQTLERKYKCTEFGRITVESYLSPDSALFLKNQLPLMDSERSIIEIIAKLHSREKGRHSWENRIAESIVYLTNVNDELPHEKLQDATRFFNVGFGDLEEIINYFCWCLECITRIASCFKDARAEEHANSLLFKLQMFAKQVR